MKNNPWDDDENPEATLVIDREAEARKKANDPTVRATIKSNGIPAPSKPAPKEKFEEGLRDCIQ